MFPWHLIVQRENDGRIPRPEIVDGIHFVLFHKRFHSLRRTQPRKETPSPWMLEKRTSASQAVQRPGFCRLG
jgi:hypothetical protein